MAISLILKQVLFVCGHDRVITKRTMPDLDVSCLGVPG